MEILGFLVIGLIAGWLASLIVRGRGLGAAGDIVVGMIGAVLGGLIFDALDVTLFGNPDLSSFLTALFGSVVLLAIVTAFVPRRSTDLF